MAVGDVYRLALEGTPNDTDTFVNVLHYRMTVDIPGGAAADNLIDAWLEDALPSYQAIMYTGFKFTRVSVRQVTGGITLAERTIEEFGTKVSGTGHFLPFQSAAIISWRTGLAGRSRRGRTYLFPALEEDQANGVLGTAYQALMQDIVDDWQTVIDSVAGDSYELVIWSDTLSIATPVNSALARALIGTVRRRRPGVGS